MRIRVLICGLAVCVALGCAPAIDGAQPTRQQLEAQLQTLESQFWAEQDALRDDALLQQINATRDELWRMDAAALEADDPAFHAVQRKIHTTVMELELLEARPPRWQFWRWKARAKINNYLRALRAQEY